MQRFKSNASVSATVARPCLFGYSALQESGAPPEAVSAFFAEGLLRILALMVDLPWLDKWLNGEK